jgi:hypothetical protein
MTSRITRTEEPGVAFRRPSSPFTAKFYRIALALQAIPERHANQFIVLDYERILSSIVDQQAAPHSEIIKLKRRGDS